MFMIFMSFVNIWTSNILMKKKLFQCILFVTAIIVTYRDPFIKLSSVFTCFTVNKIGSKIHFSYFVGNWWRDAWSHNNITIYSRTRRLSGDHFDMHNSRRVLMSMYLHKNVKIINIGNLPSVKPILDCSGLSQKNIKCLPFLSRWVRIQCGDGSNNG